MASFSEGGVGCSGTVKRSSDDWASSGCFLLLRRMDGQSSEDSSTLPSNHSLVYGILVVFGDADARLEIDCEKPQGSRSVGGVRVSCQNSRMS